MKSKVIHHMSQIKHYISHSKHKTSLETINQGLSKHPEVCFTPVTKVPKLIAVFWDLVGAIKR